MVTLKACPFCGSTGSLIVVEEEADEEEDLEAGFYACCSVMKDGCGSSSGFFPTIDEAVEAWNRREYAVLH